nr:hypothetical protein [Mesorhizobium xinjiangense]
MDHVFGRHTAALTLEPRVQSGWMVENVVRNALPVSVEFDAADDARAIVECDGVRGIQLFGIEYPDAQPGRRRDHQRQAFAGRDH